MLTQKRLKEVLSYDEDVGVFFWKIKRIGVPNGKAAGCAERNYLKIGIDNKVYLAHRLAWLYVYGYFPENMLDHINRDGIDNRISNLREVSNSCNIRNSKQYTTNKTGIRGVIWNKKYKKWQASIGVDGSGSRHLILTRDFCEAVFHRFAAEQCLGWSNCDKLSSANKYIIANLKAGSKAWE